MPINNNPSNRKTAKPDANNKPFRTNVILDKPTQEKATALQQKEKRSFNNLVIVLIDSEHKRLFPAEPKTEATPA